MGGGAFFQMQNLVMTLYRSELYVDRSVEDISERFSNAGPSARLCLALNNVEIERFYTDRELVINFNVTKDLIAKLLNKDQKLRIGDISHRICVIRRSTCRNSGFVVEPISELIRRRLISLLE